MSVRGVMKQFNRLDGDAGFPQRHAQSLQWWSTRQGLVSVPGMCIQMDANTYNEGIRGRGGVERKGKGRGRTLQMLSLLMLSQFNNREHAKGQILIIPEAVFDFLHPFEMFSFRCHSYTNYIAIKCTDLKNLLHVSTP